MLYPSVVADFMSAVPHEIDAHASLRAAASLMADHGVHELPVREHARVVGVITERDVRLAERRSGPYDDLAVGEVMSTDFYPVRPSAPLAHVVKTMAAHDYRCAVVIERDQVLGVLTTAHALRALSELLDDQAPTRQGIGPGEVREVILTEHSHVRALLERARAAAACALAPNATERDLRNLRAITEHLLRAMSSHLELEERALAPALADLPGFGRERAQQLVEEHRRQTSETRDMVRALAERNEPAPVLAGKLHDLIARLNVGLTHEEELLLNLDLLRDDGIVTECTAG